MAMASKIVGALVLVLLLLAAVSEGQVLPTPCCRIDCCDGQPECCDPGAAADVSTAVTLQAAVASIAGAKARPATARPATPAGTMAREGAFALKKPQPTYYLLEPTLELDNLSNVGGGWGEVEMASFGGGGGGRQQGPSDDGGGVPAKPSINGGRLGLPPPLTPAQLEWIREMYIKTLTSPQPRVNHLGPYPAGGGVVIPADEYEVAGAARAAKRMKHGESSGENKQQEEANTTAPKK
uniref:Granulins domain-containing protein n=1 Tax=Oryza brachyantha TaxID=4533 RepID=J3LE44_ORYBR